MTSLAAQTERLIALGVPALAGVDADAFRAWAPAEAEDATLVVNPSLVPASRLVPMLERDGRAGFLVVDLTDIDDFVPIDGVTIPNEPLYAIRAVQRGDDLLGWSPAEALPELTARGRRPLTVSEGICWLLQQPQMLEPGRCFMTIASRRRTARGLDARTPALWISGGTGRDGKERRGAPKLGWCWHNNRHTWLGFASCAA